MACETSITTAPRFRRFIALEKVRQLRTVAGREARTIDDVPADAGSMERPARFAIHKPIISVDGAIIPLSRRVLPAKQRHHAAG